MGEKKNSSMKIKRQEIFRLGKLTKNPKFYLRKKKKKIKTLIKFKRGGKNNDNLIEK